MEEILASIRRIISDEEDAITPASQTRAKPAAAAEPEPEIEMSAEEIARLFAAEAAGLTPADEPTADVLELSERQVASDGELMLVEGIGGGDVAFEEPAAADEPPAAPPRPASPQPASAQPGRAAEDEPAPPSRQASHDEMPAGPLLSSDANTAVTAAFNNLANTILSSQARTLEDLVKDMLRPMLKGWLDHNLPVMVERLVREEIERVSRGR